MVCLSPQLNTCASLEVTPIIGGVLRHDTEMNVDTSGQRGRGAFCHLLGFQSLPGRDAAFKSVISRSTPASALNPMAKKHHGQAVKCAGEKAEKWCAS
ncbi:hypothetical protein E7T06_19075 [Deinococcus sp. Arct2-2]|nr:hypothetical protein E7T06_19075 [Deinococcus sp. Arct2-2]